LKKHLDETIWGLDRAPACFLGLLADPQLGCKLPMVGSSTGAVVRHALETFEKVLNRHKPMVFKFGFTHDPQNRFTNSKFGYASDPHQKWEVMVVMFASHEPVGPAFLEALLIEKFKCTSDQD